MKIKQLVRKVTRLRLDLHQNLGSIVETGEVRRFSMSLHFHLKAYCSTLFLTQIDSLYFQLVINNKHNNQARQYKIRSKRPTKTMNSGGLNQKFQNCNQTLHFLYQIKDNNHINIIQPFISTNDNLNDRKNRKSSTEKPFFGEHDFIIQTV